MISEGELWKHLAELHEGLYEYGRTHRGAEGDSAELHQPDGKDAGK